MKKELAAAALLIAVASGAVYNGLYVERLTDELCRLADETASYAVSGDSEKALLSARRAEERWRKCESYTHTVLRHSEINEATDALCDLMTAVLSGDAGETVGAAECVKSHLKSISELENVGFGSVF